MKKMVIKKKVLVRPKITKVVKPAAKKAVGRPKGSKNAVKTDTAKKTVGRVPKKVVSTVVTEREVDPLTGFTIGTDQQIIADTLLEGGDSRADIIDKLRKKLSPTTRNGTEKPIANLMSSVFKKMALAGFQVESSFKLVPPTPASKRKANKLANKTA